MTNLQAPESGAVIDIMRDVAATEIMPLYRQLADHQIREKKPGDKVTAADIASEAALRKLLPTLLPGSVVFGEEGFEHDPQSIGVLAGTDPVWIVDPVDGTHNFAHGHPQFCIIVALYWRGVTRAGWIYDPIAGETVWARPGEGAYRVADGGDDVRLSAPRVPAFTEQSGSIGEKFGGRMMKAAEAAGLPSPHKFSRARCVGREYMDMALGKLHLARFSGVLKPWDHAAGCMIVREVGGRADVAEMDLAYEPTPVLEKKTLVVASDAASWEPLADLIRRTDAA